MSVSEDLTGETIDARFRVDERLGGGAMGEVYQATQLSLGRPVALKVIRPGAADFEELKARFEREAAVLARLDHPGIVRVVDFGEHAGLPYLVMDMVQGQDLQSLLKARGKLPGGEARPLLVQIAEALAHAHALDVVHRDLKPENILVGDDGRIRLLDFGIARLYGDTEKARELTMAGMVVGTPEYMSPEQCMGETLDGRSDLYALGVLGYRMLAGHLPFEAKGVGQLLAHHISTSPAQLSSVAPEVDPGLARVIDTLLAKKPDDRFADASAAARALITGLEGDERATEATTLKLRAVDEARGPTTATDATAMSPAVRPETVPTDAGDEEDQIETRAVPSPPVDPAAPPPPDGPLWRRVLANPVLAGAVAAFVIAGVGLVAKLASGPSAEVQATLAAADSLLESDPAGAVKLLGPEVKAAPEDPWLRAGYIEALNAAGRTGDALPHYEKLAAVDASQLSDAGLDPLVTLLGGEKAGRATAVFTAAGGPGRDALRRGLADPELGYKTRHVAGETLEAQGRKVDFLPLYLEALADGSCPEKKHAADQAGKRKLGGAAESLRALAKEKFLFVAACGAAEAKSALEAMGEPLDVE